MMAGKVPASIGAVTPGAAVLAGVAAPVGMAGTVDVDTVTSVAADVRVDIPGWAIPVVEDPAADGRAAVTQAEVTQAEVTRVVVIRAEVIPVVVIPVVVIRAAATRIAKPCYQAKLLPISALSALGPLREVGPPVPAALTFERVRST
jgi:hypothetical protein